MSTRYKYWFLLVVGFDAVDGVEMGSSSRLDEVMAAKDDSFVADMM